MEEYLLKFTLLSKYSPSMVPNYLDDMSRFFTGVADLLKEEFCTTMLHNEINLSGLIVYAQSIDYSMLRTMMKILNKGRSD